MPREISGKHREVIRYDQFVLCICPRMAFHIGQANTGFSREMKAEFTNLGISISDAETIVVEMRKATNHAAQMLQALRRTMGDVHGSKPALRRTAYEAVKWASAIFGLFEGR